jgi:RPA family protein
MQQQSFQRSIAHKLRIVDILEAQYNKVEGANPNFLLLKNKEVSRFNVIGVIIQKRIADTNVEFGIDDGTGTIAARLFEDLMQAKEVMPGDVVNIIGRPREYNDEKYILVEAIKKIDPLWAQVRGLELLRDHTEEANEYHIGTKESNNGEENETVQNQTLQLLRLIRKLDKGDGVPVEELSGNGIGNIDRTISMLLREGEIFEVRSGRVKVLE